MKKILTNESLMLTIALIVAGFFVFSSVASAASFTDDWSDYGSYGGFSDYGSYGDFSDYGSYGGWSDYGSYGNFSDYGSYGGFSDYGSYGGFSDYGAYGGFSDYGSYGWDDYGSFGGTYYDDFVDYGSYGGTYYDDNLVTHTAYDYSCGSYCNSYSFDYGCGYDCRSYIPRYTVGAHSYAPAFSSGGAYASSHRYASPVTVAQPAHSSSYVSNVTNTNTIDNSIVDNSINGSFNNYNSGNYQSGNVISVATPQYPIAYTPPTTSTVYLNTYAPPTYVPHTSYVALSQIPYTGYDFGPVGNAIYWISIMLVAFSGAYLIVYYRGGAFALATEMLSSRKNRSRAAAYRAEEVTGELVETNEHAAVRSAVLNSLPVGTFGTYDSAGFTPEENPMFASRKFAHEAPATADRMNHDFSGTTPRIVINRA
jgi:hypothetical protein